MPNRKIAGGGLAFGGPWSAPGRPQSNRPQSKYNSVLIPPIPGTYTPPVLTAFNSSAMNSLTTPKTAAATVAVGDWVYVFAGNENHVGTIGVSGGSLTYTALGTPAPIDGWSTIQAWVTKATTAGTLTVTGTATGVPGNWGLCMYVFNNSDGIGAVSGEFDPSGTAADLAMTTGDRSAVISFIVDWDASAIAGRTWLTVNGVTPTSGNSAEKVALQYAGSYSIFSAYWSDAGSPQTALYGMSAPVMKPMHFIVEVLGKLLPTPQQFEGWGIPL